MLKILDSLKRNNPKDEFAEYYIPLCRYKAGMSAKMWMPEIETLLKKEADPWILSAAAAGCIKFNDLKTAESYYLRALKIEVQHEESWNGLLAVQEKSGENKKLENSLKKYLQLFPQDEEWRNKYINLLMDSGKFRKAAAELRIMSSGKTADIGHLKKLAYCSRMAGLFRDAGIIYRQLLIRDPFNENMLKLLLYCMRKSGDEKKTIPLLRAAVREFEKPSAELLLVYGTTLYRNNETEEALGIFQKCIYDGKSGLESIQEYEFDL